MNANRCRKGCQVFYRLNFRANYVKIPDVGKKYPEKLLFSAMVPFDMEKAIASA